MDFSWFSNIYLSLINQGNKRTSNSHWCAAPQLPAGLATCVKGMNAKACCAIPTSLNHIFFFFFSFYFITQVLTHCKSTNLFFCSVKETTLQSVTRTQPIVTSWWKCSVLKPLPWIQYRSPVAEGLMRIEEPGTNITTPAVQAPCSSLSACSEFNPTCLHSWQMLMLIWLTQAEWVKAGAC